jgi:hypothetical protein
MRLAPTNGDALLVVQHQYLPNIISGCSAVYQVGCGFPNGGFKAQKEGNQHYLLLPQTGQSTIPAGTYYVGVVSEGVNPDYGNGEIGSNTTSYTLSSLGPLPVINLGTANPTNDLLVTNSLEGGDVAAYQFTMTNGLESATNRVQLSVVLTDLTGNAQYRMVEATNIPMPYPEQYGIDGGIGGSWGGTNTVLINPNPGVYTLSVQSYPSDTSYILQVHLQILGPTPLAFDGPGNHVSVTNQPPGQWQFFEISPQVPADPNLLGWDVRLINVTAGNPQMVVCRDIVPVNLYTGPWESPPPWCYTNWPSTYQWQAGMDWTGDYLNPDGTSADISTLAMGVGNPLQAGTYYIGVYDYSSTSSYTLVSRGIGFTNSYTNSFTNYSIPVYNLGFVDSTNGTNLPPREAAYYQVVVPTNTPSWRMRLAPTNGDALLVVQHQYLPNIISGGSAVYRVCGGEWCSDFSGGFKAQKVGNEHYLLLPQSGETNIPAGTYYVGVVSEGVNPNDRNWEIGSNTTSYVLSSGSLPVTDLGTVGATDLLVTNVMLESEDVAAYHFVFPLNTNIMGMEVRLQNRVGNPAMTLLEPDTGIATPYGDGYGVEGGQGSNWYSLNLITIPNPPATSYSLAVKAANISGYVDAAYDLRVRELVPALLNPDSQLNTNGDTNIVSGILADTESAFFQVVVPTNLNGAPILGWELNLSQTNGSPSVRVRQNLLPDNTCDTTAFASGSIIIAPPFLVPGTWYVEVKGSGNTAFSLASSLITTNTMQRAPWTMPMLGQADTSPGLSQPVFGDTGVDSNGIPLLGDQGVDLAQGHYDFYAVIIPTNNAGLLHTELLAISGNPQLYIRVGAAPTPNHYAEGSCDWRDGQLIDRQLTGRTTQYGSWVPLNGRTDAQLTPGIWVISVYAAGNANVRYRLILSSGNSATNGLVQDLPLDGSVTLTNQGLAGGDWRYYRVQIPTNAPNNLVVTWTNSVGSPQLFIRDTVPPGDGEDGDSDYIWEFVTWSSDSKNEGPYPDSISPGSFTLTTPPLRTGTSYYFGIWSPDDAIFSITCSTNGGAINVDGILDFDCGSLSNVIAGNSTLLYRIDVPPEATSLRFSASNSSDLVFLLEQGTVPGPGDDAQWISYHQANASLTESLTSLADWPWLPGYSYYLAITNTSASAESFSLVSLPPLLSITCPGNITVTTTNPSGVVVNYTVTVSGGLLPITTNCVPPSGSIFPIGITTVNCSVTDSYGQTNCCSFTVTVSPSPLSVTCPGNVIVTSTNPAGVMVNYPAPTVSGGCPPYTTNCVPPSGSVFPIGTNTVSCCATDSCGQFNCCSFTIGVGVDALQITPATGFTASGYVGGPFSITNESFSLANAGTNSLNWTLVNTSVWLNASPGGGTITVGGITNVTVCLNANAYSLTQGSYSATVWFTNLNDSVGQSRQFILVATALPNIGIECDRDLGLRVFSQPNTNYQRTEMVSQNSQMSWVNNATYPVTYSFTVTNLPPIPDALQTMFWFIPVNAMPTADQANGANDTRVDLDATNALCMTLNNQGVTNSNYHVFVGYKLNTNGLSLNAGDPAVDYTNSLGNHVLFKKLATNYYNGKNPTGYGAASGNGTWTLTLSDSNHGSVTGPGLSPVSFTIPAGDEQYFLNPLRVYFGVQNNSTLSIGDSVLCFNISISGAYGELTNDFSFGKNWSDDWSAVESPGTRTTEIGLWAVPQNIAYWLSWTAPAKGFDVEVTPYLTPDPSLGHVPWVEPLYYSGFSPSTLFEQVEGTKVWTFITTNNLDAMMNYYPSVVSNAFFRLHNPPKSSR